MLAPFLFYELIVRYCKFLQSDCNLDYKQFLIALVAWEVTARIRFTFRLQLLINGIASHSKFYPQYGCFSSLAMLLDEYLLLFFHSNKTGDFRFIWNPIWINEEKLSTAIHYFLALRGVSKSRLLNPLIWRLQWENPPLNCYLRNVCGSQ